MVSLAGGAGLLSSYTNSPSKDLGTGSPIKHRDALIVYLLQLTFGSVSFSHSRKKKKKDEYTVHFHMAVCVQLYLNAQNCISLFTHFAVGVFFVVVMHHERNSILNRSHYISANKVSLTYKDSAELLRRQTREHGPAVVLAE